MRLWHNKYRDLSESLSEQLAEANEALASERQRRISAEALAEERKAENDRMAQTLAHSETAREKAMAAMDAVNAKLLQAVLPQPEPLWRKQPAEGEKPAVAPIMQSRRAHQPDEATKLMMKYLNKAAEQQKLRQATKMAEANRLPGTGAAN